MLARKVGCNYATHVYFLECLTCGIPPISWDPVDLVLECLKRIVNGSPNLS
jgi:hypothetical protein